MEKIIISTTREDALKRLKLAKERKARTAERLKNELANITEKETGVRPTKFFVL